MKKTRVAVVAVGNILDKRVWSGIPFYIFNSLQANFDEVVPIDSFGAKKIGVGLRILSGFSFRLSRLINLLLNGSLKRYNYDDSFAASFIYSKFFKKELDAKGPFDLIVVPASLVSISLLKTDIPIFTVGDATFKLLDGYYPYISNLIDVSKFEYEKIEKMALHKATYNLYSSNWAASSALQHYQVPIEKLKVVSFGANIEESLPREQAMRKKFSYKLLFLGVNWQRKGGDIAYNCFLHLISKGINVQLTVCGCVPPHEYQHPNLRVIPFLDKNKVEDYKEFTDLLREHDFLLLPTRADCTPIVFCEASAYGMPIITTNTGGIEGVITNGKNGYMLPFDAGGDAYADCIADLYADLNKYTVLSASAREMYESELNWLSWSSAVKELYTGIMHPSQETDPR